MSGRPVEDEKLLQVIELSVYYGKIGALHSISVDLLAQELVAIIGANGAGKTSLINALAGLVPARSGRIILKRKEISKLPSWERVRLGLGLVPEGGRIFPELSVEKNLLVGAYILHDKKRIKEGQEGVFTLFPVLRERKKQLAGTLSGGERQMLAIGRALMAAPELLLVDEVSMGLMPKLVSEVFATLARLRSERGTSILIAEQNALEALEVVDRGYVLENGRIVLTGTAEELRTNAEVKRAYLGV